MYSQKVLKLFTNPLNAGRISKPDGIADNYNEDKSEHVEFSLRIEDNIITACKFRAQANPYIVAVCSTITQLVQDKLINMLLLDEYYIKQELADDSDIDINFCIDCVKMAVDDYTSKMAKSNKTKG